MMIKLHKQDNWEFLLNSYVINNASVPFKWGKNDCLMFMLNAVREMIGQDVPGSPRGIYSSRSEAADNMDRYDGQSFVEVVGEGLENAGFEQVGRRAFGDVVAMRIENLDPVASAIFGGITFGIAMNDELVAAPGKTGTALIKNPEIVKVWRI